MNNNLNAALKVILDSSGIGKGDIAKKGLISTNKFKSALELMTGKDMSNASSSELITAYEKACPKMMRYFTDNQEIADAFGISVDAVQAILRKLVDYNFDINLDSIYTDLGLLQTKAEKANEFPNDA